MGKFRQICTELWPLIDVTSEIGFHSLSLAFLYRFSSKFARELILGRSVFGLQMDKFYQIITELWPLIDVQNCVLLNIILTNGQISLFSLLQIYGGGVYCIPAVLLFDILDNANAISQKVLV